MAQPPNQLPTLAKQSLTTLPSELHIQITTYLSYPDALALKHTSRHFYRLVYTGVHLKVNWLVERFERKLECPMEQCSFRTDESFCNWRIRRIMDRRRRHLECRATRGGCWVVEGRTCRQVPVWWFQGKASRRVARLSRAWGYEALVIGVMSALLHILWCLLQRMAN